MIAGKQRVLRIQTRPWGGLGENKTEENEGGENFVTVFPTSALSFFLLNQINLFVSSHIPQAQTRIQSQA